MPVTSGGVSYADVRQAAIEWGEEHNCTFSWTLDLQPLKRGSKLLVWWVGCVASSRSQVSDPSVGIGQCSIGGARGAATAPAALLKAMLEAVSTLEDSRELKARIPPQSAARLPGF